MMERKINEVIILVSELNSLSSSEVIERAVIFTEKILQCREVAFYLPSEDNKYLRLVAQSHKDRVNFKIKKSITVDEYINVKTTIESRKIFVNDGQNLELPKAMVPIVIGDKVRGALAVYDFDFKSLSCEDINIFEAITEAVSKALINAYTFENAIEADRYINNTGVLKAEYFKEIIENKEYFRVNNGAEYSMVKLSHKFNNDIEYLYFNLKSQLRGMDYIGLDHEEQLYILLSNTSHEEAAFVVDRLEKRGFDAKIISNIGD